MSSSTNNVPGSRCGTFALGELVILQHASYFSEWNGAPGVITGGLAPRSARDMRNLELDTFAGYEVLPLVDGAFAITCHPYQLRKLAGPQSPCAPDRVAELPDPALWVVR